MKSDRFWETFWLSFFGLALLSIFGSTAMFMLHIKSINAAAVGVSFDPLKDPFLSDTHRANLSLVDGYAYRNALPLGVRQWAWDAQIDWTATERVYEGSSALRMIFAKEWAGMGMNGFSIARASNNSISLAIYPDDAVGDMYIELYDAKGISLGRQSLGWYTPNATLLAGQWQEVTIPLENLLGSSTTRTITGISISTKNAGTAYIDAIHFSATPSSHSVWVEPQGVDAPPYNPFATSTPATLPYTANFSRDDFDRWYAYYGLFLRDDTATAFDLGPNAETKNNDAITVFRGGRFWSDYQVKATLDWGLASVFSILVRTTDPQNFASCAFSYYGQTVQIYQVKNGVSTQLAQTPALAINYDAPWQNVRVGASVQGHRVSCYLNGERELSADIPDLSNTGTVGFEAWDQSVNASPHIIKSVVVSPMLGE